MCDTRHRCGEDVQDSESNIASESFYVHSCAFQIPGARSLFYYKKSETFKEPWQARLLVVYMRSLNVFLMLCNSNHKMTLEEREEFTTQFILIGEQVQKCIKKVKQNAKQTAETQLLTRINKQVEEHCTSAMKYSNKKRQEKIHEHLLLLETHHRNGYNTVKNDWADCVASKISEILVHENEYEHVIKRVNRHDKLSRKWTKLHLYPNVKNKGVKYIGEFIATCHDYVGWGATAVVSWIKGGPEPSNFEDLCLVNVSVKYSSKPCFGTIKIQPELKYLKTILEDFTS